MSDFILGSICMSILIEKAREGHSAFSKSAKDGRVYFNYAEWINDEANEFGQHSSILLSPHKDKKETEGKVYIGNGKRFENKPVTHNDMPADNWDQNIQVRESKQPTEPSNPADDLPF